MFIRGWSKTDSSNTSWIIHSTCSRWSSQPHGSAWVYRQAKHFLREEFSQISNSPVLHQLEKSHLIDVLQSDFLQASELEVLEAVLKWGEQQLVRRMEDRGILFSMFQKGKWKAWGPQMRIYQEALRVDYLLIRFVLYHYLHTTRDTFVQYFFQPKLD